MATTTAPITAPPPRLPDAYEHLATKADLAQLESRMTWRLIAAMVGMSGIVITAVALIVRFFL